MNTRFSSLLGEILVEPQTGPQPTATVIFLHGSGSSGPTIKSRVEGAFGTSLSFNHIQVLYPNAPEQPYTPLFGEVTRVWFDRQAVKASAQENKEAVDQMAQILYTFIKDEIVAQGTPLERIVIGGFSMGGAMALHMAYRYCPQVAGVFALSSFLNFDSLVYEDLKSKKNSGNIPVLPELFACQGNNDDIVSFEDGLKTFQKLTEFGIKGQFHTIEGLDHDLQKNEIVMLNNWIKERLKDDIEISTT